ncbi:MAG: flagellar protein FliL [Clostridia bacterium]|jgi:flagellar basal body-associated protein FliL|nr:flagellar protein FliL [Clostridia bacterium]MDN5322940.1 flagellar protein FliL [Clostridia bacterium]
MVMGVRVMENANEVEVKKTLKSRLKYILSAVIILFLSFAGAFVVGKTIFNSPDANAGQGNEIGPLYSSPEFTVNIANSNGRRFLMTQFSLEVDNKKVLKEIEDKLPVVQDKVIIVLSSQTIETLNSVAGKEKIKKQLMENINNILSSGEIVNIYFNKFVYQ